MEYKTVSIPKPLANEIQNLIDVIGYWPSLSAFIREAAIEKMLRDKVIFGLYQMDTT